MANHKRHWPLRRHSKRELYQLWVVEQQALITEATGLQRLLRRLAQPIVALRFLGILLAVGGSGAIQAACGGPKDQTRQVSPTPTPCTPHRDEPEVSLTPVGSPTALATPPSGGPASGPAQSETPWFSAENPRLVDTEIPPPVPPCHIAGYEVGEFFVPQMPNIGVVKMEAFIASKRVSLGVRDYGNGRTFNPNFDPKNTKVTLIMDFVNGGGRIIISPTCEIEPAGKVDCHHADVLDSNPDERSPAKNYFRWKLISPLGNGGDAFPNGTQFMKFEYAFKQPFGRSNGAKYTVPAINGNMMFAFIPDGRVCLQGQIDQYPSVAFWQLPPNGKPIVLARHKESSFGPLVLGNPLAKAYLENECGASLVP
jgi:hypothetical protein